VRFIEGMDIPEAAGPWSVTEETIRAVPMRGGEKSSHNGGANRVPRRRSGDSTLLLRARGLMMAKKKSLVCPLADRTPIPGMKNAFS
jgi:hypothetical protein